MTLRCLRCGDPFDPAEEFSPERCGTCESKLSQALVWRGPEAMWRMILRYRKGTERHPTTKALDALEAVPHGTLDSGSISLGAPDAEDDVLCFVSSPALPPSDF